MVDLTSEVSEIISRLQLDPHPEGGFYRQTYRSDLPLCSDLDAHQQFNVKPRPCSTAIYFLLPQGRVSHLHRIPSDEMWHFYSGGPLTIVEIDEVTFELKETILGADVLRGQTPQHVVRGGHIFGAFPCPESQFCLVGCTVSPGFQFGDFHLYSRADLLAECPLNLHYLINRMTPNP